MFEIETDHFGLKITPMEVELLRYPSCRASVELYMAGGSSATTHTSELWFEGPVIGTFYEELMKLKEGVIVSARFMDMSYDFSLELSAADPGSPTQVSLSLKKKAAETRLHLAYEFKSDPDLLNTLVNDLSTFIRENKELVRRA